MRRRKVENYLPRLFGYALSLTKDRDWSRDLVQDCAVKALAARKVPVDEPAYRAWLFRILKNTFLDQARRPSAEVFDDDGDGAAPAPDIWRLDDSLINELTVRAGLTRLPTAQREILALIDIAGFSYAETADLLGIPAGTVMSRISRARHALLAVIGESNVHAHPARASRAAK